MNKKWLALLMAGAKEELPGFPQNGNWKVEYENIAPFPY